MGKNSIPPSPRFSTTEEFIQKAKKVHGTQYDYCLVEYERANRKVVIICPIHGKFEQTPSDHLDGCGCRLCGYARNSNNRSKGTEKFITDAQAVHGQRFDYSKVEYKNAFGKVEIVCVKHGSFMQGAASHLWGRGCPECKKDGLREKNTSTTTIFVTKAKNRHGDNYNYAKTNYKDAVTPVIIGCSKHGDFSMRPSNHLSGQGCPLCGKDKTRNAILKSRDEFIKDSIAVHGQRYGYGEVEYTNSKSPVHILCFEHGYFQQKPNDHLGGHGCSVCGVQSDGEKQIARFLHRNQVNFDSQVHLGCKSSKGGVLRFDFVIYMRNQTVIVEYDGIQHTKPIEYWGGEKEYRWLLQKDETKNEFARNNGYKMVRIPHKDRDKIEKILTGLLFDGR